jgi:hypothetical protein
MPKKPVGAVGAQGIAPKPAKKTDIDHQVISKSVAPKPAKKVVNGELIKAKNFVRSGDQVQPDLHPKLVVIAQQVSRGEHKVHILHLGSRWLTIRQLLTDLHGELLSFMVFDDGSATCVAADGRKYRFTAEQIAAMEGNL